MGQILTSADTMLCPHGGSVSISALQSKAAAGASLLRPSDVFPVAGCAFLIALVPHPCVLVEWQMPSMKVQAGGDYVLTTDSIGLCKAADQAPQGTAIVIPAQARASAL